MISKELVQEKFREIQESICSALSAESGQECREDQWNYEFWVRNLFDEYYSLRGFYFGNVPPSFPSTLFERQGDPRHLGVLIRYEF